MMEKCFLDGQIPCRWVPDMGYGFGFPLFNFYPPLPYLIGQGIRLLGFSFVQTAKLTFATAIIASGFGMYFLAKEFFGRFGGVLAAAFYIWAPYHAVDIYVRGAMNESWALVWFPLIFLFGHLLVTEKKNVGRWVIALGISYASLLLTHNLMVLIFTPFFVLWMIIHLFNKDSWKRIPKLILSGILAFGLAAFFTLPALMENKFTRVEGIIEGYYEYSAHFANVRQLLFDKFWGYGGSVWMGTNDGMSFQVGQLLWVSSIFVAVFLLIWAIRDVKQGGLRKVFGNQVLVLTLFMFFVAWLTTFMVHQRSLFIWQAIPPLRYTQFPWRFLTIAIFSFSFVVGFLPWIIVCNNDSSGILSRLAKGYLAMGVTTILIMGIIISSWTYFLPMDGRMEELTDKQKFEGEAWRLQQAGGILDYLPSTSQMAPDRPRARVATVVDGNGEIFDSALGTDWIEFYVRVSSVGAITRIEQFDFPGWKVTVDGKVVDHYVAKGEEWGRMYAVIPMGEHKVRAEFVDTPIRSTANVITIVTLLGLGGYFVAQKFRAQRTS